MWCILCSLMVKIVNPVIYCNGLTRTIVNVVLSPDSLLISQLLMHFLHATVKAGRSREGLGDEAIVNV